MNQQADGDAPGELGWRLARPAPGALGRSGGSIRNVHTNGWSFLGLQAAQERRERAAAHPSCPATVVPPAEAQAGAVAGLNLKPSVQEVRTQHTSVANKSSSLCRQEA